MAQVLEVSRSGFYAWLKRPPSRQAQEDERLKVATTSAHRKTRETYGAWRLHRELQGEGWNVGRDRVARLRKEMELRCRQRRKFKVTTDSDHALPTALNLLDQRFTASRPDEVWHANITYFSTDEGWLYLPALKDQYTCEIVGYAMGSRMSQDLVLTALRRALWQRRPGPGLIHHSDRGSQY